MIFLWGAIWVTVTSLVLPFVPSEIGFDIFRGLQGLGSAAMVPTAIGILGVTFPPGKAKNYAFACYGKSHWRFPLDLGSNGKQALVHHLVVSLETYL